MGYELHTLFTDNEHQEAECSIRHDVLFDKDALPQRLKLWFTEDDGIKQMTNSGKGCSFEVSLRKEYSDTKHSNLDFPYAVLPSLIQALPNYATLTSFQITGNNNYSPYPDRYHKGTDKLGLWPVSLKEALALLPNLKCLVINSGALDNKLVEEILDILLSNHSDLQMLALPFNDIGDDGVKAIASKIVQFPNFRSLVLHGNRSITDKSVVCLTEAFGMLKNLTMVNVDETGITREGHKVITESLKEHKHLTTYAGESCGETEYYDGKEGSIEKLEAEYKQKYPINLVTDRNAEYLGALLNKAGFFFKSYNTGYYEALELIRDLENGVTYTQEEITQISKLQNSTNIDSFVTSLRAERAEAKLCQSYSEALIGDDDDAEGQAEGDVPEDVTPLGLE